MPEATKKHLINILRSSSEYTYTVVPSTFNPGCYMHTANQMIPGGKKTIIEAIREVRADARSSQGQGPALDGIDLLLRILFHPLSNYHFLPQASVDEWGLANPLNLNTMHHFPVVLIDGIPILSMIASYAPGAGLYGGNDKQKFVDDVQKHGILRNNFFKPSEKPLLVFNKLLGSSQWYWSEQCKKSNGNNKERFDQRVIGATQDAMRQLLRLVENVYPPAKRFTTRHQQDSDFDRITVSDWNRCYEDLSRMQLVWDFKKGQYRVA